MNHESELNHVGELEEDALSEDEHDMTGVSTDKLFESKRLSAKKPHHDAYDTHLKSHYYQTIKYTTQKENFTKIKVLHHSHSAPAPPHKHQQVHPLIVAHVHLYFKELLAKLLVAICQ